jgi:hypothetical protein
MLRETSLKGSGPQWLLSRNRSVPAAIRMSFGASGSISVITMELLLKESTAFPRLETR